MIAWFDNLDKEYKCLLNNGERTDILYFLLKLQNITKGANEELNNTDKEILEEMIADIRKTFKKAC